jgi:hypothetical protein
MPAPIPQPKDADHEDVSWALSTATSLQAQGDHAEALRWLKRAVTAARACNHVQRADELGRSVAQMEASLSGAQTLRTGDEDGRETLVDDDKTIRSVLGPYDLDQPTHVDPHKPVADEPTASDSKAQPSAAAPFTMKAAGQAPASATKISQPYRPPEPPKPTRTDGGTLTLDAYPADENAPTSVDGSGVPSYVEPEAESTLAMRRAPNEHELSETDAHPMAPISQTAQALTPVPRHRVALLASPDGHDPRVMLLGDEAEPPPGAGVAYLVPATDEDVGLIENLLASRKAGKK